MMLKLIILGVVTFLSMLLTLFNFLRLGDIDIELRK